MSSVHIYRHIAVRFDPSELDPERREFWDNVFILLYEGGSSNCFDAQGRIARGWSLLGIGQHYEIMQQACLVSSDCAGGMLKLMGRETKPEGYLAAVRRSLDAAITCQEAFALGISATGKIKLNRGYEIPSYQAGIERRLWDHPHRVDGESTRTWSFNLLRPAELGLFLTARRLETVLVPAEPKTPGISQQCSVHGPLYQ